MKRLIIALGLILGGGSLLFGNNIQIASRVKVLEVKNDTATLEFSLSWDNSWRDDYNWDAAWVFLKYKKTDNVEQWWHAYIAPTGHDVGANYTYMPATTAKLVPGIFIYRKNNSEGNVNTTVRLKWYIRSNGNKVLTAADFQKEAVYIVAHAVEMVYVPHGSYALGDGKSNRTFRGTMPIPAESDIIGTDTAFKYTALHQASGYDLTKINAGAVADRVNDATWDGNDHSWYSGVTAATWWKVDFGAGNEKTIRYFGVSQSIIDKATYMYGPSGDWYLQGSNDDADWGDVPLWSGIWEYAYAEYPNNKAFISYPVQRAIRVANPGKYRYYRLYIPTNHYTMFQNIAMTEDDLLDTQSDAYIVDGEELFKISPYNFYSDDNIAHWRYNNSIAAAYPKGFKGFYCMKYETSQEQYVAFLNKLTYVQQKLRIANDLDKLNEGEYVFGDKSRPNNRNGIILHSRRPKGEPVMFANNLNPDTVYFGSDDGQTLACNYMSVMDMLAYCDWSGLRPMSEMECEKACRPPYPQRPLQGEYAWNNTNIIDRAGSADNPGTVNELPDKGNVNAGNAFGPMRSGSFARPGTNQEQAGAGFWGVMDMSGNLSEMCYNLNNEGRAFNAVEPTYSHGNGYIGMDGNTDIAAGYWPRTVGAVALRGGSFASPDSLLATSDRSYAMNYFKAVTDRDSTIGFRGVRTLPEETAMTAGALVCENKQLVDTFCAASSQLYRITGSKPIGAVGAIKYMWYISGDERGSWMILRDQTGQHLNYRFSNDIETTRNYYVKRRDVCATGEKWTNEVTVRVINNKLTLDKHNTFVEDYPGIIANVGMNANIKWLYNGEVLKEEVNVRTSRYTPGYQHFKNRAGVYSVDCRVNVQGCPASDRFNVKLENPCPLFVADKRDGRSYKVAGVGPQCWMTEDLNYADEIVSGAVFNTHLTAGVQKMCYGYLGVGYSTANCDKYGGLYEWREAVFGGKTDGKKLSPDGKYTQGICPDGYHIPTEEEFQHLEAFVGMTDAQIAATAWRGDKGTQLKSPGVFEGYTFCSGDDCNKFGFSAVPGGYRNWNTAVFYYLGQYAYYWMDDDGTNAWLREYGYNYTSIYRTAYGNTHGYTLHAFAVRCVRD